MSLATKTETPQIDFSFRPSLEALVEPLDVDVYRELLTRTLAQLRSMTVKFEHLAEQNRWLQQQLREARQADRSAAA
jgi:hypothetical protein